MTSHDVYEELCYYSLSHRGPEFIHQHVVDAIGAQEASPEAKPVQLIFPLVGLYLYVEKSFTGREVQLAHAKLARNKVEWPVLDVPQNRGAIDAVSVLAAPLEDRDLMIRAWCCSVWQAFSAHRAVVECILKDHGITDAQSVRRSSPRHS